MRVDPAQIRIAKSQIFDSKMIRMGESPLCVLCRTRPIDPKWRPFCSERCRNEDLARWADGRYRVPGEPVPAVPNEEE
jgi:endogenous inhibitor of DNA gyrase (YacG/DUF329 family)